MTSPNAKADGDIAGITDVICCERLTKHRNISMMFGFIVLPITFLGGTYYPWTTLSAVKVVGLPWLQALVCLNPLIYVTEGFRAALTTAPHMPLYIIYPVLIALCAFFLWAGIKGFYNRVLT